MWREGEMDLHEAIDVLQACSTRQYGLDVDRAQEILATAFGAVRP
jgi:hypothetical protein